MTDLITIASPAFFTNLFENFGIELLFLTIILFCSISIYRSTKESYEITNHKGIKYFRKAFLFFGIAFLFRFIFYLLSYIHYSYFIQNFGLSPRILGGGSMFVYALASSIALLCLFAALAFKKLEIFKIPEYSIYILSLIIAIASFFQFKILWITQFLLAIVIIITTILKKKKRKGHSLKFAYINFAIFWIISIFSDLFYYSIITFLKPILYSILSVILLFILFKTIKTIK